jgi:hypothetical protein
LQAGDDSMKSKDEAEEGKPRVAVLDRIERWFKLSSSFYGALGAIAAVIIANQTEARRTRFTIYIVSQMWIECILAAMFWYTYLSIRKLLARVNEQSSDRRLKGRSKLQTVLLILLNLVVVLALAPPVVYIARVRYVFWTTQVLQSYVEAAKFEIDQETASGALNTALNTAENVSDVLKGTAQQSSLDYRREVLEAAIQKSSALEKGSIDAWNLVTQRRGFFSLVESVRLDPENSSAADRLAQKLEMVRNYLAEDSSKICNSQGKLSSFSGKAISIIEAKVLWEKYGSSDHCGDSVKNDLFDGWGISAITCALERNDAIRHGNRKTDGDKGKCPDGEDFWTPMPPTYTADSSIDSTNQAAAFHHPIYPTFVDLWREARHHLTKPSQP